jgi:multiple sugar transport system permease protein
MANTARPILRSILLYGLVVILLLWAVGPIFWVLISSLSTRIELYSVPIKHWIPLQPTLDTYKAVISSGPQYRAGGSPPSATLLLSGVRNSLITSVGAALIITVLSTLAAYTFARLRFAGQSVLFVLTMLLVPLPIWVSLIRLYFIISNAGLLDTDTALILIFVAYGLPLYIWIMYTYIRGTPVEMEEAALIDGCSRVGALIRVILPIVVPGLVAVFLTALLTDWNAFIVPLIFTNTESSQTLPVVLSLFIGQYEVEWEAMAAAAMVTMLPPLVLALFFQRYLVRGLSLGAIQ